MGCDPCGTCIHNWKFYNCEKCDAFWNGVGDWFVDAYDTITSVNQQQAQLQTQITMQQNQMIADAAEATWDAYMQSYNMQQEAQLLEAQMMLAVSPRIIKAGFEAGVEAVIFESSFLGLSYISNNYNKPSPDPVDPKATATVIGISFVAGFVAGSCMEIWRIFEEACLTS